MPTPKSPTAPSQSTALDVLLTENDLAPEDIRRALIEAFTRIAALEAFNNALTAALVKDPPLIQRDGPTPDS